MRSLKLSSVGRLDLEANSALPIRPGYQLWRVSHVGICKTDYHLFHHPKALNVTLGHEVVVESDGKPLVLNNEVACGECSYCLEGLPRHCAALKELGVNMDGGYADYIAAPMSHLFPVEVKDPASAVLVEPLACAIHCAERINVALALLPPDVSRYRILIIGAGISGRLVAYALNRLELELELSILDQDPDTAMRARTDYLKPIFTSHEEEYHLVLECSGSNAGLSQAITCCRRGGIVVMYGMPDEGVAIPSAAHTFFSKELTLLPSMAGCTAETMGCAIEYLQEEEAFFHTLLGKRIPLESAANEIADGHPLPGTRTLVAIREEKEHAHAAALL